MHEPAQTSGNKQFQQPAAPHSGPSSNSDDPGHCSCSSLLQEPLSTELARHAPSGRDRTPICWAAKPQAKVAACEDWVHLHDPSPWSVTYGVGTGQWPRWWYSFGNGRDSGENCALEPLAHFVFQVTQPTFQVAQCLLGATLCYHDSLQSSQISRA